MINVRIDSAEVEASLNKLASTCSQTTIRNVVYPYLSAVQTTARRRHRYTRRTGRLAESVQISTDQKGGYVYLDSAMANYGKYVHDGQRSWAPDQFLYDAAMSEEKTLEVLIERELDRMVRDF